MRNRVPASPAFQRGRGIARAVIGSAAAGDVSKSQPGGEQYIAQVALSIGQGHYDELVADGLILATNPTAKGDETP